MWTFIIAIRYHRSIFSADLLLLVCMNKWLIYRAMEPDLSFINADISLDQVKPLDIKRVVAFVNYFLMKTTRFLNSFAVNVEQKIIDMESRVSRIETELELLEARLDSIPGIGLIVSEAPSESIVLPDLQPLKIAETAPVAKVDSSTKEDASEAATLQTLTSTDVTLEQNSVAAAKQPEVEEPTPKLTVRDDPRYAKYFKMLRLGVVEAAVKLKMKSEGVDPSILDKPDAPSVADAASEDSEKLKNDPLPSSEETDESGSVATFSDSD